MRLEPFCVMDLAYQGEFGMVKRTAAKKARGMERATVR